MTLLDRPTPTADATAVVGSGTLLIAVLAERLMLGNVWAANHLGGTTAVKRRYPPWPALNTAYRRSPNQWSSGNTPRVSHRGGSR